MDGQERESELAEMLDVLNAPAAEGYVRTDEREDVIASLDLLALVVPQLRRAPANVKVVIVAPQRAQGALVCALSGTAGVGALDETSCKAVLKRLKAEEGKWPRERLAEFTVLVGWACEPNDLEGEALNLTETEKANLRKLNDLRNEFMHFQVKASKLLGYRA